MTIKEAYALINQYAIGKKLGHKTILMFILKMRQLLRVKLQRNAPWTGIRHISMLFCMILDA